MGRKPNVPYALKNRPFTLAEAREAGLTQDCLRGKSWRRLGAELYCWRGFDDDPWELIAAWRRLLPQDAIFAGTTAAWLWGIRSDRADPIDVILRPDAGMRSRRGLHVRRCSVPARDVTTVRGLRATTLPRTLCDLCARLPLVDALIACDAAMKSGHWNGSVLPRERIAGVARLRELARVAAPAESPMETRLRWLLLDAGLPRPEVQVDLRDDGRFIGRADLYYPNARLVIEYDGGNHRDRLVEDDRRQNRLVGAGFALLRFTAPDLGRPEFVVSQVRRALLERPL